MSLTSPPNGYDEWGNRCGLCAVSPIVGVFQDIIPWDKWTSNLWHWVNSVLIIVLFVVVSILIISYVLGTIITIIRYYNYKVVQQGESLKLSF